jgi:hypothetical protein
MKREGLRRRAMKSIRHRGVVAPMQVFGHQQQGFFPGVLVEQRWQISMTINDQSHARQNDSARGRANGLQNAR